MRSVANPVSTDHETSITLQTECFLISMKSNHASVFKLTQDQLIKIDLAAN